ncbi:hypothetical protein COOONC_07495 [Cooperia oncophora]
MAKTCSEDLVTPFLTKMLGPMQSTHSEAECICMVEVRFVLFHRNMNGKAQLRIKDEFPCCVTVREVIDHFRIETDGVHRGVSLHHVSGISHRCCEAYSNLQIPLKDTDSGQNIGRTLWQRYGRQYDHHYSRCYPLI